jgi:hypothetical protein
MDINYGKSEFIPQFIPPGVGEFCAGYLATGERLWRAAPRRDRVVHGWAFSAVKCAETDCLRFRSANTADVHVFGAVTGRADGFAGHNFWLSRNGFSVNFVTHGAGPIGRRLHKSARAFGPCRLILHRGWLRIETLNRGWLNTNIAEGQN